MSISQQITALRKGGNLDGAEELALNEFLENKDDKFFQSSYGWVIYFRLKNITDDLKVKKVTQGKAISLLNYYVDEYAKLNLIDRPDLLHSMILMQVLKVDKEWVRFLGFAKWWGIENFREDDYKPLELKNGKKVASLNLRFYYRIGHALTKRYLDIKNERRGWAEDQLNLILRQKKDDQWLRFYESKLLLLKGDSKGALKSLKLVIKKQSQAFWAWAHLGDIISLSDSNKAILCYQHAINLSHIPTSVVNVREKLAKLLVTQGKYIEAVVQITKTLELRKILGSNKISNDLNQMINTDWYKKYVGGDLPKEIDVSNLVNDIIYNSEELIFKIGVIDNQNKERKLAHVSFGLDDGVVLLHNQFSDISSIKVGTVINVFFEEEGHTPIRWKGSEQTLIDGFLQEFSGFLELVPEKEFGFIRIDSKESIFVPPYLMHTIKDKTESKIKCIGMLAMDKSKGKKGWKALAIL
jgi:tetratricopeptide (TPR) repeat protein